MKEIEKLKPFTRFLMTIGELPSSYLISMTYEEQLLWFCNYLKNTVIPTLNNNAEAVIELQNYIQNYFNNLDVQEEINNKLDEMAESGQLTDIIAQYLQLAGVLAFNNVSDLKNATNIVDGSTCRTLGNITYNDGYGSYYKIRTITSSDVVDEENILSLEISNTLIAEKIKNQDIEDLNNDIDDLENDFNNITESIESINNKIDINNFNENYYGEIIYESNNYSSYQSGTIIDDYLIVGLPNNNENNNSLIKIYDLENEEFINEFELNAHHIDNMTNDGTYIYINDMTEKKIIKINKNQLREINPTIQTILYTENIGAIAYNNDKNEMYSCYGNKINKLDNNFEIVETITIDSKSNIAQGLLYYDKKYFISKINNNPTILNNIVILDENFNVLSDKILNDAISGESEFIANYNNKVFDFKTKNTDTTLLLEIYEINYKNEFTESVKFSNDYIKRYLIDGTGDINIYCNNTVSNIEVLGTIEKPFHNIKSCLEFITNIKIQGNIKLYINGTYNEQIISFNNIPNNLTIDKINSGCTINTLVLTNGIYTIKEINILQLVLNNCYCNINKTNISKPDGSGIISNNSKLKIDDGLIHDCYYGINSNFSDIVITKNPSQVLVDNDFGINATNNSQISLYQGAFVNYKSDYLSKFEGIIYLEDYANLNNYKEITGNYSADQYSAWHVTNLPNDYVTSHAFNLKVEKIGISNTKQILTDYQTGDVYTRIFNSSNSTWTNWIKF